MFQSRNIVSQAGIRRSAVKIPERVSLFDPVKNIERFLIMAAPDIICRRPQMGIHILPLTARIRSLTITAETAKRAVAAKGSGSLIVFLVGIPLITMRSFSEERRSRTDQLLLTAPVSLFRIVMGKYLAMITVIAIPNVIFCIYPLIIRSQGTAYLTVDYISIFVFFLLGCVYAAIGMFISALTESQMIAFISTCLLYTSDAADD
mgnify:CR=1 FL=1